MLTIMVKKIMTLVGTRPEIIKLSRIINELDENTNHILVHTGQNYDYELNEIFFSDLSVRKPDYFLNCVGRTTAETIANIISKSDEVLEKEQPDAVVIYGDTNSCLSVISAKRRQIPIFHLEAGNRCFDQRVPEEINRKIVDHLSDINLPLTEHARRYLLDEGIRPETVIKIGSCMKEILTHYKDQINSSTVMEHLKLKKNKYFLVSMHREENVDYSENLILLLDSLNSIADKYKLPIIISTHPRTKIRIEKLEVDIKKNPLISFMKPMGFFDYVNLQLNSKCTISDSGTLTEEASLLKFPAIMIRSAHERPEGMDYGTLIMSGINPSSIIQSIDIITKQHLKYQDQIKVISDYDVENVSSKILRIILSYTEYINNFIWKKNLSKKKYF